MVAERNAADWNRPGRIAARLARQVELGLAEVDLSLSQYRVLMLLSRQSEGASKLADHLAVSRPSITSVVDGLAARGLVVRNPHPEDRRRVQHALTPAGRRLLRTADEAVDARFDEIVALLQDPEKQEEARTGLGIWREALEAYRATLAEKLGAKS